MPDTVDVQDLRVGMFIHLDLGWMSHPFPLSSFKLASAEQIATVRKLGLKRVRWNPAQSDPAVVEVAVPATSTEGDTPRQAPAEPAGSPADATDAADATGPLHAQPLARQRAAIAQCTQQHGEACRDLRRIQDQIPQAPLQASEAVSQLASALLGKMLTDDELCVRVLGEVQGDHASAHAMNVAVISMLLGRTMDMPRDHLHDLGVGALMHDIGKLGLPDRLRNRAADFTASELQRYQQHVAQGVVEGRRMALRSGALLVIAQHHEHADGSGFPQGLALERISAAARIVAIVNRFDNLCNPRLQAKALTPHEALSLLFAQNRAKFDVAILNAFVRMMGVYPPGSVVQLSNDAYAMVMMVNPLRPLKPRVLVFDPAVAAEDALHLDLETCPDVCIRRSLARSQLPGPVLHYLAPPQRVTYFFDQCPAPAAGDRQDEAPTEAGGSQPALAEGLS
jgi:HD-GYP domain-containing protein (c-di-GMP phosphodiesterase class II)